MAETGIESGFVSDYNEEDLMDLIERLVESHDKHVQHDTNTISPEELEAMFVTCEENCKANGAAGRPDHLDFVDYCERYEQTGEDVDGRRTVVTTITIMFETAIRKAVRFFKDIPEMRTVSLEDQVAMIKGGVYEYLLMGGFKGDDWRRRMQVDAELNHVQCEHDLKKLFPDYYLDALFRASKKLQDLQLNMVQIIVLKAIVVTSPDREAVKDHDEIGHFHWKLVECLRYLLHHEGREFLLSAVCTALTDMREFSHCCRMWGLDAPFYVDRMRLDVNDVPLLKETFFNQDLE